MATIIGCIIDVRVIQSSLDHFKEFWSHEMVVGKADCVIAIMRLSNVRLSFKFDKSSCQNILGNTTPTLSIS